MRSIIRSETGIAVALAAALLLVASSSQAVEKTYTTDADFDEGTLVNVNHDPPNNDQLQLDSEGTPFNFIWINILQPHGLLRLVAG